MIKPCILDKAHTHTMLWETPIGKQIPQTQVRVGYVLYMSGCLRGLAVVCWTTDHYHPCSNLGVGISEGCFVFDFTSLPLEVARPI